MDTCFEEDLFRNLLSLVEGVDGESLFFRGCFSEGKEDGAKGVEIVVLVENGRIESPFGKSGDEISIGKE